MKTCQNCAYENDDNAKFCTECGEKLVEKIKFCPECGIELENQPKFCPDCGTKIGGAVEKKVKIKTQNDKIMDGIGEYIGIIPNVEIDSLWDAVRFGYIEEAEKFLKEGEEFDDDLICDSHDRNIVNLLVKYGARVDLANSSTTVLSRVISEYDSALDSFYNNYEFNCDIFHSEQDIHNKYIGIIDALIKNGADPDSYNPNGCCIWTPLQYACGEKLTLLAKYLITICNVDVNHVPEPDYNYEYEHKVENGADISKEDVYLIKNNSPLLFALDTGWQRRGVDRIDYATAKLLIENGADVTYSSYSVINSDFMHKTTSIGRIIYAISTDPFYEKNFEILELLIENGAELEDDDVTKLYCIENDYAKKRVADLLNIDLSALDEAMDEESADFIEDGIVSVLDNWLPNIVKEQERWITKSGGTFEIGENPQRIQNGLAKLGKGYIKLKDVLGFIDLSMWGKSGKDAMIFTNEGLAFDYAFEPTFIPYKNMQEMYLKKHALVFSKDTRYKSHKDGKTWYGSELTISDTFVNIAALKECLDEIIEYLE